MNKIGKFRVIENDNRWTRRRQQLKERARFRNSYCLVSNRFLIARKQFELLDGEILRVSIFIRSPGIRKERKNRSVKKKSVVVSRK